MLKLVLIALEILKRIQQSRETIKVSLTYQSQCSSITYQDALNNEYIVMISNHYVSQRYRIWTTFPSVNFRHILAYPEDTLYHWELAYHTAR